MPQQDLVALAREAMDAWNSHDPMQVAKLCAEDVVVEGDAVGAPLTGREAYRQFAQTYMDAFPDLRFEFDVPLASADRVVVEWRAIGTNDGPLMGMPPTGRQSVVNGCNVIEYRDGKIARQRSYWDAATLLRNLGLMPARAGTIESPATSMEAITR